MYQYTANTELEWFHIHSVHIVSNCNKLCCISILDLIMILDEYRVKVERNYEGNMSYGNYLLKVYNEEIRLFTPNGLIPTKFRCPIKDIHKAKYYSIGPHQCCVTISIKNAHTR